MSYLSDMDDLDMTCSDFVNALKMLICSEKHLVSRANHGYAKKVVIHVDRWQTIQSECWAAISTNCFVWSPCR